MNRNQCLACDVLTGRIEAPGGVIYKDDHWVVDHSVSPVLLRGFLIIKPKRHCEQIAELTIEEMESLGPIISRTANALTRALHPEKIYVSSFGEFVRHIHFYVIPRTHDMPPDGPTVIAQMFDGRWACSDDEAAEVANRIREMMES